MQNNTTAQRLYIPRVLGKEAALENGVLTLVSTTDHKVYNFPVIDVSFSGLYFVVSLTLEEGMPAGEYEYCLYDGAFDIASNGLVLLFGEGQVVPHPNIYEQTIEYEQYQ